MAYTIKVDGTIVEKTGTKLTELQAAVGGYIQMVATKDGRQLVCNEEGKITGLPINVEATKLYQYGQYDPICGDVVVCEMSEIK